MMISTRGRYALRVLTFLSKREGYVPLSLIAESEEISEKYLERIVKTQLENGIIDSKKGKDGGYRLKKDPSLIHVDAVLSLTGDSLAPVECLSSIDNKCPRKEKCPTLPMWEALYKNNLDFFSSITIENLKKGEYSF